MSFENALGPGIRSHHYSHHELSRFWDQLCRKKPENRCSACMIAGNDYLASKAVAVEKAE